MDTRWIPGRIFLVSTRFFEIPLQRALLGIESKKLTFPNIDSKFGTQGFSGAPITVVQPVCSFSAENLYNFILSLT